jgi:hypothetical protein
MDRPTITELVRRVDVLEEALDRMLTAFKADLGALRADLRRLEGGAAAPARATSPSHPSTQQPARSRPSGPSKHSFSEELASQMKKDPRSDD